MEAGSAGAKGSMVPEMSPQADPGHWALCRERGNDVVTPHSQPVVLGKVQKCSTASQAGLVPGDQHLQHSRAMISTSLTTPDPRV